MKLREYGYDEDYETEEHDPYEYALELYNSVNGLTKEELEDSLVFKYGLKLTEVDDIVKDFFLGESRKNSVNRFNRMNEAYEDPYEWAKNAFGKEAKIYIYTHLRQKFKLSGAEADDLMHQLAIESQTKTSKAANKEYTVENISKHSKKAIKKGTLSELIKSSSGLLLSGNRADGRIPLVPKTIKEYIDAINDANDILYGNEIGYGRYVLKESNGLIAYKDPYLLAAEYAEKYDISVDCLADMLLDLYDLARDEAIEIAEDTLDL